MPSSSSPAIDQDFPFHWPTTESRPLFRVQHRDISLRTNEFQRMTSSICIIFVDDDSLSCGILFVFAYSFPAEGRKCVMEQRWLLSAQVALKVALWLWCWFVWFKIKLEAMAEMLLLARESAGSRITTGTISSKALWLKSIVPRGLWGACGRGNIVGHRRALLTFLLMQIRLGRRICVERHLTRSE